MRQGLTGLALLGLVLAGCGGGDKQSETPESTGILHTKIQGVTYRTPTRSGKTDANGNFKYLAGETVTFSIGGIELGSAPGASNISLFTLAGMTAPTSELAMRRELNRLRYTATPLSNAANRAQLLLALDSDGDPSNGIDVSAHESALAGATLSFDQRIFDFPAKASRLSPGMNNNIPYAFSITWLYRSLGMAIAAHVPNLQLDDLDGDGVVERRMTVEVDASGEIVTTIIENADGVIDRRITLRRDSMGRITRRGELSDMNLDGVFDRDRTTVTIYDLHGNPTRVIEWEDAGVDDSLDSESISESTFDTYGRRVGTVHTLDVDYDGRLDAREVHTYTLDARGNVLNYLIEVDADADGSVNARYLNEFTWDAADRQLSSRYDRDSDADGQVDSSRRTSSTYGASANPLTYDEDYDYDGDGVHEQQLRGTYTYDAAGNVQRLVADYEAHYDGFDDAYRYMSEMTYDGDRRPLTRTLGYDFDKDGTYESHDAETNTYDANGFLLSWEYVADFFAGDGLDWVDRAEYSYTPEGAQRLLTQGTDFDGDGTLELYGSSEIQYAPSNNAVPQIVTQYVGF